MTAKNENDRVYVRRQWNDWRIAGYPLAAIGDLHWSDESGGIRKRANRFYLHGYVWCNEAVEGELAHSCSHGKGPHRIKVCVVKRDNSKAVYDELLKGMRHAPPGERVEE